MLGEVIAARFLETRGWRIMDRNVLVDDGEIDLIVSDGNLVAVEVKTATWDGRGVEPNPANHFTDRKAGIVHRGASSLRIHRVDLIAITLTGPGIELRWFQDVR